MRNSISVIAVLVCLSLGLTACEAPEPSASTSTSASAKMTRRPTGQKTMSPEGMLCGVPMEFWRSVYDEAQLGEYIVDPESKRPDPTPGQQTPHYDCFIFNGETGKYFSYAKQKLVRITVETATSGSDGALSHVNSNINEAPPEMQIISRNNLGWLYPGSGLPSAGALQAKIVTPGHGVVGWTCGKTYVIVHVDPTLLNGTVGEVAAGIFDQIVEGVECSTW